MKWMFLSYSLSDQAFGYGNGDRFEMSAVRSICCGDTSNNSRFSMPTHFGTHIDYPYHFGETGKKSGDYQAKDFVFESVGIIEIAGKLRGEDLLIRNADLQVNGIPRNIEALIVKTGFCNRRSSSEYWSDGYGFASETAAFLKSVFPSLRLLGFDLISLNSYRHREEGRKAHRAFLLDENILILEEMDLREINAGTQIGQLIVSPLQLPDADGAPCTVFSRIDE